MSARRTWFSTIVHTIDAAVIIQWQYDSFQRDDPRDQHRDPRERYCRKRKTKLMADSFTESLHVYIFLFRFVSFFFFITYWSRYEFFFYRVARHAFNLWVDESSRSRNSSISVERDGDSTNKYWSEFALECERYAVPRFLEIGEPLAV